MTMRLENVAYNNYVFSSSSSKRRKSRSLRHAKSGAWNAAWPILLSMKCLGILGGTFRANDFDDEKRVLVSRFNLRNIWRCTIFLILHGATVFNLTQVFISENSIWRDLSGLLRSVTASVTAVVIAYNEDDIRKSIKWCFDDLMLNGCRYMLRLSAIFTIYSWLWAFAAWSIWVVIMLSMNLDEAFRLYYFGTSTASIPNWVAYLCILAELIFNTFLNHCVVAFSLSLYVILCHGTKRRIGIARHNALFALKRYGFDYLATIRNERTEILDTISHFDNVMSKLLFLWYCYFMFLVCFDVTNIIQAEGDARISRVRIYMIFRCTTFIVWFIALTLNAAAVHEEDKAFKRDIERWVSLQIFTELKFYGEYLCLVNFFQEIPLGMTAWNFFLVRRKVLLTIPGTIITYMVILFQLNPKVMGVLNG